MTRKPGLWAETGAVSETLDFAYDADGRRTRKTRTVRFSDNRRKEEISSVLWSGALPIFERRVVDGQIDWQFKMLCTAGRSKRGKMMRRKCMILSEISFKNESESLNRKRKISLIRCCLLLTERLVKP